MNGTIPATNAKGYVVEPLYGMYLMGINPLGKWKKRADFKSGD
jgi:hypothetical protein